MCVCLGVETKARGLKRKLFNPDGGVKKAGRIEVPSQTDPAGEVADDMEWSGAPGEDEGNIEMLSQDQSIVGMECSGAEGEEEDAEMLSQSQTSQVPSQSQDAMDLECSTTLPLRGAWRQPKIVHITTQ